MQEKTGSTKGPGGPEIPYLYVFKLEGPALEDGWAIETLRFPLRVFRQAFD